MTVQMVIIQLQAISSEAGRKKCAQSDGGGPIQWALDGMESDGLHELLEFMYILRVSWFE